MDVQKTQNKLLRILEGKRIGERMPVKTMLQNQKMLSVNQLAAQIKLLEVWKAKQDGDYLVRIEFQSAGENERRTREDMTGRAIERGRTNKARNNFVGDATRIWKRAPTSVTEATTLRRAKKAIKEFCQSLPV